MLLKVIKRLEETHTLFSICSNTWILTSDVTRRVHLHKYLVKNHLVPYNLPISDLTLESRRDSTGHIYWEVHRLNNARSLRFFIKVEVFSKQKVS